MTTTVSTIADLLASQQIKGEVSITGRITSVDRRTTAAGNSWAIATITDHGLDTIDVHLFPKVYAALRIEPCLGDTVHVTGRRCLNSEDQQLIIYGEQLDHVEL